MAVIEMNWRPSNRDLRVFAVVQLIVACVAAWLLHRRWHWDSVASGLVVLSLGGLIVGMITPQVLRLPFLAWMLAAFPIGWVMSHVLLGIVYYGVVTPIGLVLRLRGRDVLQLKPRADVSTYWIVRPKTSETSRYFRQF